MEDVAGARLQSLQKSKDASKIMRGDVKHYCKSQGYLSDMNRGSQESSRVHSST